MKKKLLSFLLCTTMAATALTGCGSSEKTEETAKTETVQTETQETTEPEVEQNTATVIWGAWDVCMKL